MSRSQLNNYAFNSFNVSIIDPMSEFGSFMHRRLAASKVTSPNTRIKSPVSPLSDHPVRVYKNKMQIRDTISPTAKNIRQKLKMNSMINSRNFQTTMENGEQIKSGIKNELANLGSLEFLTKETPWKKVSPKLCFTSCVSI